MQADAETTVLQFQKQKMRGKKEAQIMKKSQKSGHKIQKCRI